MDLASLPFVPCNHRTPRVITDLVCIHTNEGPDRPTAAEDLAHYLQGVDPGYNVVVDENSAVRTAGDREAVWGAGGVNSRAWHLCLCNWSANTGGDWSSPESTAELTIAAGLVRQACDELGVPKQRVADPRPGAPRGILGHGDVSRIYPASMGHTDPGPAFPWDRFLELVNGAAPTPDPPHPSEEDPVSAFVNYPAPSQLNRFYVSHDGVLWQAFEGTDGVRHDVNVSSLCGFGPIDTTSPLEAHAAPNFDLIVGGIRGASDHVYNEARYNPNAHAWTPHTYR